jgi:hypothetical protein
VRACGVYRVACVVWRVACVGAGWGRGSAGIGGGARAKEERARSIPGDELGFRLPYLLVEERLVRRFSLGSPHREATSLTGFARVLLDKLRRRLGIARGLCAPTYYPAAVQRARRGRDLFSICFLSISRSFNPSLSPSPSPSLGL